jgi:ring-1,2-phenylacetyl-CoA epoxidase subunit PaaC
MTPSLPTIEPDVETKAEQAHPHGVFDAPVEEAHRAVLFDYLLRLGDDSLVLGQRLGEWCGHAPSVEVDLSLANFALDLIGQATHFLGAAGAVEGKERDSDLLAFHRDVLDYRNCLMVEQPNGDFAQTMARQFLFSTWQKMLFGHLEGSRDAFLASVAAKAVKEVTLPSGARRRMGDPARRRHRGEPPAHGRWPRLDVALHPGTVRDGRDRGRGGEARLRCRHEPFSRGL